MSATNRGAIRVPQDGYMTPMKSILPMVDRISIPKIKSFLEPCRGTGNIYDSVSIPIKRYCEISEGLDYMNRKFDNIDLIMTNPPFAQAMPFILKSLKEAKTVIYLLRLNFLGSQKRKQFWQMIPPTHLYVLSHRPKFINNRTDATEYAWFCWDSGNFVKDDRGIYVL